jgi:transposase
MLALSDDMQVFVATAPVDMRKSIDGLSMLVVEVLAMQPKSSYVFVFYNRACKKVKILYWDRNGFVVHYKRLQNGKFRLPRDIDGAQYEISLGQLTGLLAGLDFHLMSLFPEVNFNNYF